MQEQVVVVEHIVATLPLGVRHEHLSNAVDVRVAPREGLVDDVAHRRMTVHHAAVDRRDGAGLREARASAREAEVGADEAEQVGRVALIEHGERRPEPDGRTEAAEQPVGDRVERAAPHATCRPTIAARRDPSQHLLRGAAAEGEQQDALGCYALVEQVHDAGCERLGLAGSRAGDDEQRSAAVLDGRALALVEVGGRSAVRDVEHRFDGSRCKAPRTAADPSATRARRRSGGAPGRAEVFSVGSSCRARPRCPSRYTTPVPSDRGGAHSGA